MSQIYTSYCDYTEFNCFKEMTIKIFVAMPTTNSQMAQKKYMCIYVHTLYTHAHTFIYICI